MRPLSIGLRAKPISLDARAMAAVKRSGGVVHLPGAATPVLGPNLVTTPLWTGPAIGGAAFNVQAVTPAGVLVVGKNYLLSATVSGYTGSGTVGFSSAEWGGNSAAQISSNGVISAVVSGSTTNPAYVFTRSTNTCTLSNIRLEEVTGYTYGNPPARNFFDSAGTDIIDGVTQMDNPVGLALDAAGRVGPELNPDTGFTNPAGWSVSGADATHIVTFADGKVRYQSGLTTPSMTVQAPAGVMPPGTYEVTATCSNWVSGSIKVFESAAGRLVVDKAGTVSTILKTTIDLPLIFYRNSENVDLTLSFLGIKRIYGDLASQGAVGSKPTIRRGLLNECLWSQWGGGGSAPTGWLAFGNGGAQGAQLQRGFYQRVFTSLNSRDFIYQSVNLAANATYTVAVYVDANTAGATAPNIVFQGSMPAGASMLVPDVVPTAGSFILATITTSSAAGAVTLRIGLGTSNVTTGTVTLSTPALFFGTVTAQQIIDAGGIPLTTTAPASSARGKCWWQFDATAPGDCFSTNILTGETGWVCAGVTLTGALANNETIFASGAGNSTMKGVWLLRLGNSSHALRMGVGNGVELTQPISQGLNLMNTPRVVEGGWDASTVFAGVDGNIVSSPRSGSASPPATTLNLGTYIPGIHPMSGASAVKVYCPVVPPAQDRDLIRRWAASLQGRRL